MKNTIIIASFTSVAVASAANAAFVVTQNATTWANAMTALPVTYTDPGSIAGTTGSGVSWTGGDGWEAFSLTGGPAGSISTTGTSPAVTALNFAASTVAPFTFFVFDFVGSEAIWGPSGTNGLYGVLFNITFSPGTASQGVTVVVNGTQTLVASGADSGVIGVYQNSLLGPRIDTIQFTLSSGQQASLTGFTVGVIPAPGAMALLSVAGLVGTRRRR